MYKFEKDHTMGLKLVVCLLEISDNEEYKCIPAIGQLQRLSMELDGW